MVLGTKYQSTLVSHQETAIWSKEKRQQPKHTKSSAHNLSYLSPIEYHIILPTQVNEERGEQNSTYTESPLTNISGRSLIRLSLTQESNNFIVTLPWPSLGVVTSTLCTLVEFSSSSSSPPLQPQTSGCFYSSGSAGAQRYAQRREETGGKVTGPGRRITRIRDWDASPEDPRQGSRS